MNRNGNVVLLTGLTFAAETSALLDHAPDVRGAPNLVAVLGELNSSRPCVGHWHAGTMTGSITFGPAIGDDTRTVALYASESEDAAIDAIVEAFRKVGGQVEFATITNWSRLLADQEFERLSDNQKVVVLSLQDLNDPRIRMGIMLSRVDIADVRKAIIAGNGDPTATMAELEKLSPANNGSDDDLDHGVLVIEI